MLFIIYAKLQFTENQWAIVAINQPIFLYRGSYSEATYSFIKLTWTSVYTIDCLQLLLHGSLLLLTCDCMFTATQFRATFSIPFILAEMSCIFYMSYIFYCVPKTSDLARVLWDFFFHFVSIYKDLLICVFSAMFPYIDLLTNTCSKLSTYP